MVLVAYIAQVGMQLMRGSEFRTLKNNQQENHNVISLTWASRVDEHTKTVAEQSKNHIN
jgi:hypothetical protein